MAVNKGGRPKVNIDLEMVERLASVFCTQQDIADTLNVGLRTLHDHKGFRIAYHKGIQNAKTSIRRAQFNAGVEKGNVQMLIWLGKQYLNQREPVADIDIPDDIQEEDMSQLDES
jgi:hypothetical protein